ncbi:prepilin-type N-terminal cleavage/methylation domain-containing protein [Gloeocapsa sp. BRSZ]
MRLRLSQFMRRSSDEGLTLIESLVAIAIIGIVLAAIAPPLLIAAATRVQNQRTEQAMQIAHGEINRIRLIVERRGEQELYQAGDLPPVSTASSLQDTPAPKRDTTGFTSDRKQLTSTKGLAIYVNRDAKGNPLDCRRNVKNECIPDFVVQLFRQPGITPEGVENPSNSSPPPNAFRMGVRVYEYQAFLSGNSPLSTQRNPLSLTSQNNLQHPLAVVYTTVARSQSGLSLEQYRQLLDKN